MNKVPTLVFDLDGTISDPAVGIVRSINYALETFAHPVINADAVSAYIGPPIDEIFRKVTGISSPERIAKLVHKFRERYADVGYAENTLYDGIPEALTSVARTRSLALCTSKRTDFALKILALFKLDRLFSVVSGGDVGVSKSSQLAELLRESKISKQATMIGDRAIDIQSARLNGLRAFGVLWGHGSREELIDCSPDALFTAPADLLRLAD